MSAADQTHHAECWRDPAHHACAVREVERLRAELDDEWTENQEQRAVLFAVRREDARLREAARTWQMIAEGWLLLFDGVTEPVHPVYWIQRLEHTRRAVEAIALDASEFGQSPAPEPAA